MRYFKKDVGVSPSAPQLFLQNLQPTEKKRKRELLRAGAAEHRQQPQDFDIHASRWGRH